MNIEATCLTLRALLPSVGAKRVSKVVYAEAVDWSCKAWRLIDSNQTRPNDHDTGRCKLVIQGAISFHYMSSSMEAAEQSMPGAVSFDGIVHEFMEDGELFVPGVAQAGRASHQGASAVQQPPLTGRHAM